MADVIKIMSADEAKACVHDVRAGIANIGRRLLDLYEGQGWLALGYQTWRECAEKEFGFKQSRIYQLLESAEVNRNISTMVEKPVSERVAREIAKVGNADKQREVAKQAIVTAVKDKAGRPKVTAKHVQKVVASRIGNEAVAIAEPEIEIEPAEPKDSLGTKVYRPEVQKALARAIEFDELKRSITRLKSHIAQAVKNEDGLYYLIQPQQWQAACQNLFALAKFAKPYAQCPYCRGEGCKVCKKQGWVSQDMYERFTPEDLK